MKKLLPEEISPLGWVGRASPFYQAIIGLRKDEALLITYEEWKMYKTPSRICRYIEKKFPVKYLCTRNAEGWVVKRTA